MSFTLPTLNYEYNSLEPHIDAKTMEIHHSKHHQAYITNLNNAIAGTEFEGKSLEELMSMISKTSPAIRNNGGGHFNHSLFWKIISPNGGGAPTGKLAEAIENELGGFEKFKTDFAQAAMTRFGSGWAWLCVKGDNKLCICSTPNQDNPLMDTPDGCGEPIVGLDVWEHAYYLHYQNRRADYVAAFWNVIDWEIVGKRYEELVG
ncbi:MAG: superoxide dismutase [Chitinophagaceae bacterium]|nr:superoxide dismutase [Chitinophagaceae bacterium]